MIIRKVKVTEYEYQAPINYVAGATEPDIQFQMTDYEIPSGATGRVYVGRSDGTFEYTVATISGNNVTVAPTSSMFSVKGPGAIQVTLYVGNEVVKNFAVPVYVHADLADDSAEAGSDVTGVFRAAEEEALADFQEQAEEIAEEVKESIPADYTELTEEVNELNERLDTEGLSENVKVALLDCFEHVAWIDEHGQDYYDALEAALYPDTGLVSISAVFTQGSAVIYPSTPLNDLKAYLVVTGYYNNGTSKTITDYSLSGALEVGTSTITVSKEGKTDTFDVVVSSSYWDYEWYASSRTLPEGMTSDGYDFTTESGAMFAETPNLDFDFIGNCEFEVEMKAHVESSSGTIEYGGSNPQIVIKNAVVSSNQFRGAKIILNFSSSGVANLVGIGINGVNSNIQGIRANDYHVYNVRAENNVYSLSVDGETKQVTQNNNTSQYFSFTGLASSLKPDGGFYGAFIKSIKFKRL